MKKIIFLLLLTPMFCMATEKARGEGELPFNMHEFDWKATLADGTEFTGHGLDNTVRGALVYVRHQMDKLAKDGTLKNGTEYDIELEWRGVNIVRGGAARSTFPVEMPRGPDKVRELPRGPSALKDLKDMKRFNLSDNKPPEPIKSSPAALKR